MEIKELYEKISNIAFATRRGVENTSTPNRYIEQAKNILYNNMDAIEEALKKAVKMEKDVAVLTLELDDAERELTEIKKAQETAAPKKTTAKKKALKSAVDNE